MLAFYGLSALAAFVGYKWYERHSENGARRVYSAYHTWVRTGRDF